MYARVTRVKGDPAKIDQQVEQVKAQLVPVFKQQGGYLGVISVANRETGEGATTTYWDSLESMKASQAAIFAARDKFAAEQGAEILSVHNCEIAFSDRKATPHAGTHVRVVTLTGITPANRAQVTERHRTLIAPEVLKQPGALASLLMLDLDSDTAFAVSSWETAAQRDAAAPHMQEFAAALPTDLGITRTGATDAETTHADLPVPATTG